jgi:hypothetical protein
VEVRAKDTTSVQAAIHDLREIGYRVDYADGRYYYRGEGMSMTKHPGNGKVKPVCLKQYIARQKRSGFPVPRSKQVVVGPHMRGRKLIGSYVRVPQSPVRVDPKSVAARVAAGKDIFIINQGSLHHALKSLPQHVRPALLGMSKKVQEYNRVARLYAEAQRRTNDLLSKVMK